MPYLSYSRGHSAVLKRGVWYYEADGVRVDDDPDRPCARCGRFPYPKGYDACIGYVPGVFSACCGHGVHEPFIIMDISPDTELDTCASFEPATADKARDNSYLTCEEVGEVLSEGAS